MPGIVGLVTKMPRKEAELQLFQMVEKLSHEDFYVAGTWVNETLGVYVGWVARKGSFSDGMPLRNENGDTVLIFSGEEFPDGDTLGRLRQRGHVVDRTGPSYLVHLYEDDTTFPACLNGRFHGLLIDQTQKTLILFNDRYGMDRIYYHESKEAFYFAAEAKAILAVRPELRRSDPRGLGEFVACGCVLENRTLFEAIYVLPPASAWVFRNGSVERKGAYFQPKEWEDQPTMDPESYYRELREIFSRNLPRYFEGPERIGMSLTGGLDSRMIMAWHKPSPGSLPCYTFGDGSGFRQCRDVIVAQQVARACGQSHEIIPVGEQFLSRFPHYAERTVYLTDGCLDLTHSPDLYLNEKVRMIAPVRMTGNYGSEVLRRFVAFRPSEPAAGLFRPEFLGHVHAAKDTYASLLQGHPVSFAVFRQAPWHHFGLLALEQTQLSLRSPYLDNDLVRTAFRAPDSTMGSDILLRMIAEGDAALHEITTDRGLYGNRGHFSAAAHRTIHEFLFKAEYRYDSGMPQWVARIDHLLSPFRLERLFLGWHKFHHFRVWYRDALSGYVREMLLDQRTLSRPYLDPRKLESIVTGHLKGNQNYTAEIHKVLTLELLHRLFLDPK
jgi:asparagine synthase (glutamine-hydrolysing)